MVEINNVLEHVEGDEITGMTNKDHWDNEVERKLSQQMVEAKGLVQLLYSIHWQIYLKASSSLPCMPLAILIKEGIGLHTKWYLAIVTT